MIGGTNVAAGGGGSADLFVLQKSLMEFTSEKVIDWVFSCDPKIAGPAATGNQLVALNVKNTPYQLLKFREFDHSVGMFLATCFNLSHLVWDAYDTIDSIRQDANRMTDISAGGADLKIVWALLDAGEFVIYDSGVFYNQSVVGNIVYTELDASGVDKVAYTLESDHIKILSDATTSSYNEGEASFSFENAVDLSMFGTLEVDISFSAYSISQYARLGVGASNNDGAFELSTKLNNIARAIQTCDISLIIGMKYPKIYHYNAYDQVATTRIYKIALKL
jgi:hypothetical protein